MADESQPEDLENILIALQDKQTETREHAIQRLQRYVNTVGEEDESLTLAQALEEWDQAREQILQDSRIVEALLKAIDDSSVRVRAISALLLGNITIPEAQEALIRHLQDDPVNHVRMMCVAALGFGPPTPRKLQGFIAALQDPHYQVVFPACKSLGRMGDPQAIEPLRTVLTHPSWSVRFNACEALVELNAVDARVVNLLEELNQQPEAQQHNEMVQSVNELNAELGGYDPQAADPQTRARTTQEVLERARRLLKNAP